MQIISILRLSLNRRDLLEHKGKRLEKEVTFVDCFYG